MSGISATVNYFLLLYIDVRLHFQEKISIYALNITKMICCSLSSLFSRFFYFQRDRFSMFFTNTVDGSDRVMIGVRFQHTEDIFVAVCDHKTMLEDWKRSERVTRVSEPAFRLLVLLRLQPIIVAPPLPTLSILLQVKRPKIIDIELLVKWKADIN